MAKKRKQQPEPEEEDEVLEEEEVVSSDDEEEAPQILKQQDSDDENISTEDEDEAITPAPVIQSSITSDGRYHNKQRLLMLSSRGITARYRHLLEDLRTLIPHSKKESKLDVGKNYSGGHGAAVNEIAEVRGCHTALFLECKKRGQDGYLWLGRTSHANSAYNESGNISKKQLMITGGPSVKFHITNIHTMDELKMTGNCMKGSRPILSFDKAFDTVDHLKIVKHVMVDVFGTPRGHPKSKPFVDRVMGFYYADGKIWVRNYQIMEEAAATAKEAHAQKKLTGQTHSTSLIEIGPRFVLNPIRIFRGSFGGQTLWQNDEFVSPNVIRAQQKREKGEQYVRRKGAERSRKKRKEAIVVPDDPLADVF